MCSGNVFSTSASRPDLEVGDDLLVCINRDGVPDPVFQRSLIHGALIQADTITAEHLAVDNLSAIVADLGVITAGLLKSANEKTFFSLDESRIRCEDPDTGEYIEITSGRIIHNPGDQGYVRYQKKPVFRLS